MKTALIISLLVTVIGITMCGFKYFKVQRSKVCWGSVVSLAKSEGSEGESTYSVVATFRAHNEQEYYYRSSFSSSHPGYNIGDGIRIFYNPEDPTDNGIMSFTMAYGFSFFLAVLGGLSSAICASILFSYPLMEFLHPKFFIKAEEVKVERY